MRASITSRIKYNVRADKKMTRNECRQKLDYKHIRLSMYWRISITSTRNKMYRVTLLTRGAHCLKIFISLVQLNFFKLNIIINY